MAPYWRDGPEMRETTVEVRRAGTDALTGTAALAAITTAAALTPGGNAVSATNRATVLLPPGIVDFGTSQVVLPDGVCLAGYGQDVTYVKVKHAMVAGGASVKLGDGSVVSNMTIDRNQADEYGICIGICRAAGITADDDPIGGTARVYNCRLIGPTDCVYVRDDEDGTNRIDLYDCLIESAGDTVAVFDGSANTVNLHNCTLRGNLAGTTFNARSGIGMATGSGTVNMYGGSIVCSGGSTANRPVAIQSGTGTANLRGVDMVTSGTGAVDLHAVSGSTLSVRNCRYDPSNTSGQIDVGIGEGTICATTGVQTAEYGDASGHKTVFTLTAASLTITDAAAAGAHGTAVLYTFPEGHIRVKSTHADLTVLAGAGGITDDNANEVGIGSAAVGTDNDALTSTEDDLLPGNADALAAGTKTWDAINDTHATLDGSAAAATVNLNAAFGAACTADDTLAVTGTVTIHWEHLGDD